MIGEVAGTMRAQRPYMIPEAANATGEQLLVQMPIARKGVCLLQESIRLLC
jgi:hypothetical protein